jgi:general secretion pathway protein A
VYESFFGFKEKPFEIVPDPSVLYLSSKHDDALKYLEYGIERNTGILLLTGEVGSGKTTLIRYLVRQCDERFVVAFISNTNLTADQLLMYVLLELNIRPDETGKAQNLQKFKGLLKSLSTENRRALLIFDEAQNLPKDALEEIRMLSNFQADDSMPLQIFLIGQPELRTILKSPGTWQIRQRIAVNYHLSALDEEETRRYIEYRLVKAGAMQNPFNPEAVDLIYKITSGIPRSINILCDSCLLYGFAEELKVVDGNVVKAVVAELNLDSFVTKDTLSLRPPRALASRRETVDTETFAGKTSLQGGFIKKAMVLFNKKIDRLDVKMDLLRKDVLNMLGEAGQTERESHGDLLAEFSKMRSDYDKLKATLENAAKMHKPEDRSDYRDGTEARGAAVADGKVYKLEK